MVYMTAKEGIYISYDYNVIGNSSAMFLYCLRLKAVCRSTVHETFTRDNVPIAVYHLYPLVRKLLPLSFILEEHFRHTAHWRGYRRGLAYHYRH